MQDLSENGTVEPTPPRFWWLKRLSILSAVLIVALVALRLWWGWEAQRRLDALVAEWHAAGQPVYTREFDEILDAVADKDNAALLYERAVASMVPTTMAGMSIDDFLNERRTVEANLSAAAELLEANADVLGLARQARGLLEVAWSGRLTDTVGTRTATPAFFQQRMMTKLLWLASMYHFQSGDHAEVVETLHDYSAYNAALDRQPYVLAILVAQACHALCYSVIEDRVAALQVAGGSAASGEEVKAARREQIQLLIQRLADEEPHRAATVRAHYGARAQALLSLDSGLYGYSEHVAYGMINRPDLSVFGPAIDVLAAPALVLDQDQYTRSETIAAAALRERSFPVALQHFPSGTTTFSLLYSLAHPGAMHGVIWDSFERQRRTAERFFRLMATRRMAVVALAIRLYVVDHGRRPETLAELVPTYLDAIPSDPFSPDGSSIRYRPNADLPVLYSLGEDGVDDEGVAVRRPNGSVLWKQTDVLFFLDGRPLEEVSHQSPPSTQAGEGQQNVKEKKGEQYPEQPSK